MIWSILEIFRRPQIAQQLTADVSRYSPSQGATYNVREIISMRLLQSLEAETRRLRIAELFVHSDTKSVVLDKSWIAPGGVPILAFTHDIALKPEAWQKAQPQVLKRPLEEYWPERFLTHKRADAKSDSAIVAKGVSSGMSSIEPGSIGLSNVCQKVLGRAYANAMHAATLAVLSHDFEIQLCDTELYDQSLPPPRTTVFGTFKPLGEVALRVRKRSTR